MVNGSRPSPRRSTDPRDHARYVAISQDERFILLRRKIGQIIVLAVILFLGWYLLYVVFSAFARDLMGYRLAGNINVALVFGVLQFLFTFFLARRFTRYSREVLDSLTAQIVADADWRTRSEIGDPR